MREQGPEGHLHKEGTPTAAGWAFFPAVTMATFIGDLVLVPAVFAAGAIGLADDAVKLSGRRDGVPARWRLLSQVLVGTMLALALQLGNSWAQPSLWPWLAATSGPLYAVFAGLLFAGVVNGVNFTDGADGLLAATLGGAVVALLVASSFLSGAGFEFPIVPLLPMVGVLIAWWFFNRHPAKMFMGETGSYLLGAWVFVAGMEDPWLLLALATIPLWELLSVVIQVVSYRTTGRRVFKMAPFHHHLELSGWSEKRLAKSAFLAQFALTFGILYTRSAIVGAAA
ncbi:hypothetical protein IIA16_05330 [bacterium]|nr:hypothetical protein [bacterium]